MENQRLFLYLALAFVGILLWSAWQQDYRQLPAEQRVAEERVEAPEAPRSPAEAPRPEVAAPDALPEATPAQEDRIRVVTDLFDIEISTRGGDIRSADLVQHHLSVDDPTPFPLLTDEHDPKFIAQSGLETTEGPTPNHRAIFHAEHNEYRLPAGEDRLEVPLVWTNGDGLTVTKRYIFHRDSYLIDVTHEVDNASEAPWDAYQYVQLRRTPDPEGNGWFLRTYTGGVVHTPDNRYQRISYSDMADEPLSVDAMDGWVAMIQHYFLGAAIPARDLTYRFYTRAYPDQNYVIGMSSPWQTAEPGEQVVFADRLYIGPKEQDRLSAVAQNLELTVDYGFLSFIARPLFWLLDRIHDMVGNWGWSILILTLLIKLVFYKLSETSGRSMAKMRKLQPKMMQLRERFGDDRQRMNHELMELYRKEKVNPVAGCLPILIQIPVFIALYWVLLESVELRQAPFILWIRDLSVPDPFYVLPLLMGVSMFLQQKLNPAPLDPVQQRIMMALPLIFTVFFAFFPAGLVLYWVANNTLSIAQQWVINRRIEREPGGSDVKKT